MAISAVKPKGVQLASGTRVVGRPQKESAHAPLSLIRKMIAEERLDGRWGSWLGIAYMNGRITADEWYAALYFADAAEAKERALASPGCNPRAQDVSGAGGRSLAVENETTIRRHRRAMERWAMIEGRLGKVEMYVLDIVVARMQAAESFMHQMALKAALKKISALRSTGPKQR